MLGKYFTNQATELMDSFMKEKGLDSQDMINWTNEHSRRKNRS